MSTSKTFESHCAVLGCKTSSTNKSSGVTLHPFPTHTGMKAKWTVILKDKCSVINWAKSRICSNHFENKYFDSSKKLKENAVPSIFTSSSGSSVNKTHNTYPGRTKVDRLLNRYTISQLQEDIQSTVQQVKIPYNYTEYISDDLHCDPEAPVEIKLWLLTKKQDHLIARLKQDSSENKKHIEILQKKLEVKKELEESIESYKYIVKCLQEKHATLEEQIEILTAIESR